ncbi:MAG: cadherin domain-containing protein [Pseudomonadales bacterium]|nr:cadherin domain-containing protein [Pseudomonadales bacterium]
MKTRFRSIVYGSLLSGVVAANGYAAPIAIDDAYSIDEDSILIVPAPGVLGNDSGDATLFIEAVEFVPGIAVGVQSSLLNSGALHTVFVDGSLSYDTNGQFEYLAAGESIVDIQTSTYTFRYRSEDLTGQTIGEIRITINGVNDAPTLLDLDNTSIVENAGASATVGNLSTADVDTSDTHVFSLVAGTGDADNASFTVTGTTLAANNSLDREVKASYSIRLQVSDGNGGTFERSFTISVTDLNDTAPIFTSSATSNVNEGQTSVLTVIATDPDTTGTGPVYSITGGADLARFSIGGADGVLIFNAAQDFESPTDGGSNNVYDLEVSAFDGTNTTVQSIAVTIVDINDNDPVITSANSATVNENDTTVLTVTSTDADGVGPAPVYAMAGGDDAGDFTIGSADGVLIFNPAPDFDNPTDAGSNNVYVFNISVFDGVATVQQTITVTVQDLNDSAPVITSANTVSVNEKDTSVMTVTATDADSVGPALVYAISGGLDSARFTIGSSSGSLTFTITTDFEAPVDNGIDNVYDVDVSVFDGETTVVQSIVVTILNVNDSVPIFTSADTVNVNESETAVITVQASDADAVPAPMVYSIVGGDDAAIFLINSSSGDLIFNTAPDFESPTDSGVNNIYVVNLSAFDTVNTTLQTLTIRVVDLNDNAPAYSSGNAVNVNEGTTTVLTVTTTDTDGVGSGPTYTLSGGADIADFSIDSASGALVFASTPDFESPADADTNNVYLVEVSTSDGTNSTAQTITVTVLDLNDIFPVFSSVATVNLDENDATVLVVTTTDGDGVGTGPTYSITGGADGAEFSIGSATGSLIFSTAPDFESPTDVGTDNVYIVQVSVFDGVNTSAQTITITVNNLSDEPPTGADKTLTGAEDSTFSFVLADFSFADEVGDAFKEIVITNIESTLGSLVNTAVAPTAIVANGTQIPVGNFGTLTFTPIAHVSGNIKLFDFKVKDATDALSVATYEMRALITAVADTPVLTVANSAVAGDEDTAISLGITSELVDADGSETISLVVTGHPTGSTFDIGADSGSGTWTITTELTAALTVTPPANQHDDFPLTLTSTVTEISNGVTASTVKLMTVVVYPVNDNPSISPQSFSVDENSANDTIVGTVAASDIEPVNGEPAQNLIYSITGTAFKIDGSTGEIKVNDSTQLDAETAPTFSLQVTVTDDGIPNLDDSATITISLNGLEDNVPVANTDNVNVDELATLNFNPIDNDADADVPANTLTVVEVNGDIGLVGVPFDLEVPAVPPALLPTVVGTLTINSDGSSVFVTNSDVTVEEFSVSTTYRINDGTTDSNEAIINFMINPINDNQPSLTADGVALQIDGVQFDEDEVPNAGAANGSNGASILINDLFFDLDIDKDGLLDSDILEDLDSLQFSIVSNSNSSVVQTDLQGGDLFLFSGTNKFGTATIRIAAQDQANPLANQTTATLDFIVTVASQNDAPIYNPGFYVNTPDKLEDSGDVIVDLVNAFADADQNDDDPSDETLTYQLTITDSANEFVATPLVDETGFSACASPLDDPLVSCILSDDTPAGLDRTLVLLTQDTSINLVINTDAHGTLDISVQATDLGLPIVSPSPGVPVPLFAVGPPSIPFRVTINAIGDDTPGAEDDHYSEFPNLVMNEDGGTIIFNVIENDYQGDTPAEVISVGTTIIDKAGQARAWRTTSRLADPDDTGDFAIEINGEVSCAYIDCQSGETPDTAVDGSAISQFEIAYQPRLDFNGEDSFTYCIRDSAPGGEVAFTPPSDVRCATVTVNVLPTNDPPVINNLILITMVQADDLVVTAADGLANFVRDPDNTHLDGLGCDPLLPTCNPDPTDPQPDRLYFYFDGALTLHGQLFAPFLDDGSFNYRPSATFAGNDEFGFQVCDLPTPGDADHCDTGVVSIQIAPLEGAPEGSSDGAVQFDYQLANTPLELPIGPEPNVLIVNDDSGSMRWGIMANGSSGLYQLAGGFSLLYVNRATAGSSIRVAPAESDAPNQGLWRLRNASFNTVYYNPAIRYEPWKGLDAGDVEFPNSPPTAARHNPLSSSPTTNLTNAINFTGVALNPSSQLAFIASNNFYIPRYYKWNDRDSDGQLDSTPSPALDPSNSEGELVLILDDGTLYDRSEDRTDCISSEVSCSYDEEIQNFANWFTYSRNREFTAKSALGIVVANAENIRIGYGKLNSNSNLRPIESMNTSERTGAKAALLDAIYATNSNGGTPLRRALRDAGRYFECREDDIFNSNSDTAPGDSACPVLPAPDGNCQQHFTLLLTDGTWNGSSPFSGNSDGDNNTNFDGGAFAGPNFTTLADVAMLYYERDLHPSLNNEVPTTARDRSSASDTAFESNNNEITFQHMTTYTVGFGVSGLVDEMPSDYTQGFNWGNPFSSTQRKTDDVRHAAYNGRGEYLDAANGAELAERLVQAFEEFSQGSGAASAVSFNSQEIQEDTLIFRAFYNTKINTGDLIAQRLTDSGLTEEPVWRSAEVMDLVAATDREIFTYDDVAGQGIPFRPGSLNIAQRAFFISDTGATLAQQNTEVTQRVQYLRGDSANERPVGNFRERPTIEGRLGDIVHSTPVFVGAPNRAGRDAVPFPQSDLYSAFVSAQTARQDVIYVEANDGMLHGFDPANGSEVFGFVPNNLMLGKFSRKLTELLDFNYSHKFFNDLTPAINDVYIDLDGGVTPNKEWATVLIGGQGAGAKAYYALDITDPTALKEATAANVVLWEFTDDDDTYPVDELGAPLKTAGSLRFDLQAVPRPVKDLGYTFNPPSIAMSNAEDTNGNKEWVAIFGNGYNSTAGIAKLFVLFVDKGADGDWCHPDMRYNNGNETDAVPPSCIGKQDFVKIDTGFGVNGGFPNGLGTARSIDADGNGTVDYVYAGDTFGNFFRFDLTSSDFTEWSFAKIFKAEYDDGNGNITDQPITTQPIVTRHPTEPEGFIVIFATGSYITVPDGSDKGIQSIYGLWDRLAPELLDINDLVQQRYVNEVSSGGEGFGNVRSLTTNEVDYSVVGGARGWYNHLDSVAPSDNQGIDPPEFPGEKAIRNIQLRGGLAFVNSIIPRSDTSCVDVAGGFALAFCPGTGSIDCLSNGGIFDLNNDGEFSSGDEVNGEIVAGLRFEDAVPTDSSFIEDQRITQLSDKSLDIVTTNTSFGGNTGRLSWKQLDTVE